MADSEINIPTPENKIIKKKKTGNKPIGLMESVIVIVITIVLGSGIFYMNKTGMIKLPKPAVKTGNSQSALAEDQAVLIRLKQIMLLPEGVTPNMAVILDADSLRANQPLFFANAKNGDWLILYPDMAIIFDAQAGKIVKIGPVTSSNPPNAETISE